MHVRLLGPALAALCLAACAHSQPTPCVNPPPFYVALQAAAHLNPSASGQSLTTQVKVFELKAATRFNAADLDDLWRDSKKVLGDELVQQNEVSVDPGATVDVGFPRDANAAFVAAVGLFRQPNGTTWRALAPLGAPDPDKCQTPEPLGTAPKPGDQVLTFHLEDSRVTAPAATTASRGQP